MDPRFQAYRKVEVNTNNRGKIVVMLFSGAITFLSKTRNYMVEKDYENKNKFLTKALNIIDELNISLDMEKGGEIAQNLKTLYLFLIRYLHQANIENSLEKIDETIKILERLKSGFDEILQNPENLEAHDINRKEQTTTYIKKIV